MHLQQAQQTARPNQNAESNADRLEKIVHSGTASKNTFDVVPKVLKDLLGVKARGLEDNFTMHGIHEQTSQNPSREVMRCWTRLEARYPGLACRVD